MRHITITTNDLRNARDLFLNNTQLREVNQALFKALVPAQGKAPTTAGETVRKANRLVYRYLNDGDICPTWNMAGFADMSESTKISYVWNYLYRQLKKVAATRAGKAALVEAGLEVEWAC